LHFLLLARLCPFSPQLAQVCSSVDGPDDDACSAMWSAFLKFFAAALNFLLSIYVGRLICLSPLVHEEGGGANSLFGGIQRIIALYFGSTRAMIINNKLKR